MQGLTQKRAWISLGCGAAVLLFVVLAGGQGCLGYLVRAGCGQASILWKRRPIRDVLADSHLAPRKRRGLEHVLAVQRFATESLSLHPGNSYTLYSDIGRDAAAYNVTAAPELALQPHTWWFPVVGTVPYLGFFSKEEARTKARELEAQGLETVVQSVSAYSTLGWFSDPLLSSQLALSDFSLTRLVIHETAHATLWFPGDVRFNESFASFVELEGALAFYRARFGEADPRYRKYVEIIREGSAISHIFRRRTMELDKLYKKAGTTSAKRAGKAKLLVQLREDLMSSAVSFQHYDLHKIAAKRYNNAHLLSYRRYDSGQEFFRVTFEASGRNWRTFLGKMAALRKRKPAEREQMMTEIRKTTK